MSNLQVSTSARLAERRKRFEGDDSEVRVWHWALGTLHFGTDGRVRESEAESECTGDCTHGRVGWEDGCSNLIIIADLVRSKMSDGSLGRREMGSGRWEMRDGRR